MSDLINPGESISVESGRGLERSVKVSFYPVVDDYAHIAQRIHASSKIASSAQYALNGFLTINLFGLPAVLWYFDMLLAGVGVFLLNVIFTLFFLPAIIRQDYRRYYRSAFRNLENELTEVELTESGVWCRHADNFSFHAWKHITLLEETKQAIYLFYEHNGIAIAKSGFAYDEQKDVFLAFAKQHVEHFTTG